MGNINSLYNLVLTLIGGCIIPIIVTIMYIIGIVRYAKKESILEEKLQEIEIRNMERKENI